MAGYSWRDKNEDLKTRSVAEKPIRATLLTGHSLIGGYSWRYDNVDVKTRSVTKKPIRATFITEDENLTARYSWRTKNEDVKTRSVAKKPIRATLVTENENLKAGYSWKNKTGDVKTRSVTEITITATDEKEKNGKLEKSCSQITRTTKSKGLDGLSENFKDAFLSEEDSDVIIKVGDQTYPAHKVIIKARSSVFKAMLNHEMREKKEGVINIPDCDPGIFRNFLFYVYTGKIDDISKENVFELHHVSDKYDVKDLKTECVDFILKNLSVDIICDVISLATRHSEQALLAHAVEFFTDHAQDILPSVKWQIFVKDYPVDANELFLKTFNKISGK